MLEIKSQSNKLIILLHEIYGINEHMRAYAEKFSSMGYDVICPNLIQEHTSFSYEEEVYAYQNFNKQVGFKKATNQVKNLINKKSLNYKGIYLVGFSVGATIGWLCSDMNSVNKVVGYYGSRIRDYLNVVPKSSVLLFYGDSEKSFDISLLINSLTKKGIEVHQFAGKHGFADSYSINHNLRLNDQAFNLVSKFFED